MKHGDDGVRSIELIEELVRSCPRRAAGSEDERRAFEIVAGELERLGLEPTWHDVETHRSLYALLALHGAVGVAGTLVAERLPLLGAALHGLAGASYFLDSSKQGYLLRRVLPRVTSHNVRVTLPASTPDPALRIVVMGHVDAAFTGLLFSPRVVQNTGHGPAWLQPLTGRPLATFTWSQLALAALDLARVGPFRRQGLARLASWTLTIPAALNLALNLEVVLRDEVVPGANDNLTGVATLVALARRFLESKPDEVELVLVATGAEEAGLSGSIALARDMAAAWSPRNTVVLAPDSLCHGELCWYVEGEVVEMPVAPWLEGALRAVAASDPRFKGLRRYKTPAGASDAQAFLARGYDAVGFGCIDPAIGAPRHYHQPSDTPANLDPDELLRGIDFTEALIREICAVRLG